MFKKADSSVAHAVITIIFLRLLLLRNNYKYYVESVVSKSRINLAIIKSIRRHFKCTDSFVIL